VELHTVGQEMIQNDITLGYSPACGGFLLFHLLLLSQQYHAEFVKPVDIPTAIANQWNIKNHTEWKHTEYWPDNNKTSVCDNSANKIYFYCNPSLEEFTQRSTRKIMLYSDINSQLALAQYKNAHWYYDQTQFGLNRNFIALWNSHYSAVKAPGWPRCISPRHIDTLPQSIQQELLLDPYTQSFVGCNSWQDYIVASDTTTYQKTLVLNHTVDLINAANECVSLQELVNSRGSVLVDKNLIPTVNTAQTNLIEHWLQLHPVQLLDQIGVKY